MQTTAAVKCVRKCEISRSNSIVTEVHFEFLNGSVFDDGAPGGIFLLALTNSAATIFVVGNQYEIDIKDK